MLDNVNKLHVYNFIRQLLLEDATFDIEVVYFI